MVQGGRRGAVLRQVGGHFQPAGAPLFASTKAGSSAALAAAWSSALLTLLTARAKRSLRGGGGGGSVEAQEAFRGAMTRFLVGTTLFLCLILTVTSVKLVRYQLGEVAIVQKG